ncbi:hypothetical protein HRAG_02276 [Helicobacter bilis ATCC 43879]|uniref:Uncharacterized protein n=2 Tax=Helicobacter TaxID=209 RepID=T5LP09_9HELI|nr:hypothetical protein [Helicobacter bilis]EQM94679.1 hypothetical protein HRAG_02276 [Helicobacter bilis ATCC 43879]
MILNDRFRHFVYMCLITTYVFCQESPNASYDLSVPLDEKSELYKIGHKIVYEWRCDEKGQCNQPSFKCDNESRLNDIELEICSKADEWFRGFTSIILYDNFFTSYYHLIMQHTPKDKKQEIKRIAKEAMKQRDSIDIQQCVDNALNGTDTLLCIDSQIVEIYYQGLYDITQYLLANDKNLFAKIFNNPKTYQILLTQDNIEVGDMWDYRFFGTFYQDNLIDKTGKLIVKVDSK